jgi:sulfatase maturation enzyme AslB (radical SAM superfamily)
MAKQIFLFSGRGYSNSLTPIVKDKWDAIFVSLDSFEEINDAIRGNGAYQKVVKGLEALKAEKEKQNSSLPYVGIVSTISNLNYMHLATLAASMKDKGLSWHIINLGTYMDDKIGTDHEQLMKEKLDCDAGFWKGFSTGYNEGIDGDKFSKILEEVHAIDNGYPIITVPIIRPGKIS